MRGGDRAVELFNGVDSSLYVPLSSFSFAVLGNASGSSFECLDWVVQRAREIHQVVVGVWFLRSNSYLFKLLLKLKLIVVIRSWHLVLN